MNTATSLNAGGHAAGPTARALLAALAAGTLGACRLSGEVCTADLVFSVTPAEATLRVGATQTFSASAVACSGTQPQRYTYRWSSSDTAVARVDSVSGVATARRAGTAFVGARALEQSSNPTPQILARVTVTP